MSCQNNRGISFIKTAYKVISNIMKKPKTPYAEEIMAEYYENFEETYNPDIHYKTTNGKGSTMSER